MIPERPAPSWGRGLGSWALLAAVGGLFGVVTGLPDALGVVAVLAGVVTAGVLQRLRNRPRFRDLAPIPALGALVGVAIVSAWGPLPELIAGGSGVAFLLWLADDLDRPLGGVRRAQLTIGIPALAVGIAWASSLLLPPSSATLGVAAALLVLVAVAVAFLFGAPSVFDREEPSPS